MPSVLVIVFILCLSTAFLLSGMEAGVFALSRLHVRQRMRAGDPRARTLYGYLEKPEDFLWTILVGNTVASFCAVSIGVIGLYSWLMEWPVAFWLAVLAAGLGFYALCELLPKMLFRLRPNRLCLSMVVPFGAIALVLRPLVAWMAMFSKWLLRWSGGQRFTGHLFGNRDELRLVMQESALGLTGEERAMINRVLDLQNLTVQHVAIPLSKVASVSVQTPLPEVLALCRERRLSRLPVWQSEGARRRIAGLVSLKSLLYQPALDDSKTAGHYLKPALYLDQETRLEVALRHMQRTGQRLAIVLGRDRAEIGVVSLQDILNVIFGQVTL